MSSEKGSYKGFHLLTRSVFLSPAAQRECVILNMAMQWNAVVQWINDKILCVILCKMRREGFNKGIRL